MTAESSPRFWLTRQTWRIAISCSSYTSNEFVHATRPTSTRTPWPSSCPCAAPRRPSSPVAIYVDESGLTEVCDYKIQYDSLAVDESIARPSKPESSVRVVGFMPCLIVLEYTRPLAAKWAEQNADKPCINVMAQGPLFGAAYVFSICNVQEMLQIDSCTINTCDFFHGPFEILDKRTSLFQLISVGRSRCNDERGIRFVNQYGGERVYQLDAKELGLNDIKDSVSEYFNHLIFAPILNNVYMRALSAVTHKDYMTRRYMWKLDY